MKTKSRTRPTPSFQIHVTPLLLLLLSILFGAGRPDPELLMDFCIADTTTPQPLFFNGFPCIDPALALSSHFATSALSRPGDTTTTHFGFNATLTTTTSLPGANAQGLSLSRTDLAPGGLVPPHSHPRASEVAVVLHGTTILVGFVDTSGELFAQQLRPGDAFVFPKGMLHFLYNVDPVAPATVLSGLGSQSPGVQVLPMAAFRSEPPMPEEVLKKAFQVSGQDIQRIQRNLGG